MYGVEPFKGRNPWETAPLDKERSQIEELRVMLGSGPILDGVEPVAIQTGKAHAIQTPEEVA